MNQKKWVSKKAAELLGKVLRPAEKSLIENPKHSLK